MRTVAGASASAARVARRPPREARRRRAIARGAIRRHAFHSLLYRAPRGWEGSRRRDRRWRRRARRRGGGRSLRMTRSAARVDGGAAAGGASGGGGAASARNKRGGRRPTAFRSVSVSVSVSAARGAAARWFGGGCGRVPRLVSPRRFRRRVSRGSGYVIHHHGFAGASVAVRLLEATLDARGDAVRAGEWALVLEVAPERRGDARAGRGFDRGSGARVERAPADEVSGDVGVGREREGVVPDAEHLVARRRRRHRRATGLALKARQHRGRQLERRRHPPGPALRSREKSIPPARADARRQTRERGRSTRRARSIPPKDLRERDKDGASDAQPARPACVGATPMREIACRRREVLRAQHSRARSPAFLAPIPVAAPLMLTSPRRFAGFEPKLERSAWSSRSGSPRAIPRRVELIVARSGDPGTRLPGR